MKICVCSAATENLSWQYDVTNKIKLAYCNKHGYDFIFKKLDVDKKESYHFRKKLLLSLLDEYDWVVWMDVDAWFNNFDMKLEDLIPTNKKIHMIISRDHYEYDNSKVWHQCYINSGVIMIKGDMVSKKMIELWSGPTEEARTWMKQNTKLNDQPFLSIRVLWDSFFADKVLIKEPKDMNWFLLFGDYEDKFILHAAGIMVRMIKKEKFLEAVSKTCEKNSIPMPENIKEKLVEKKQIVNSSQIKSKSVSRSIETINDRINALENFVPAGFDYKPTLRRADNYNKPFGLIEWN